MSEYPSPSAFEQAVTQAREELDNYKNVKSTHRENFEKWANENGFYEDEHYYMQGSQTRRHYNEAMWVAWEGCREQFIHIGYVPLGGDTILKIQGFIELKKAGVPCIAVYKI